MGLRQGLRRRRGPADHRSGPWTSGINLIDTAEIYGFGRSERAVGKAIADRRDEAFVATKVVPAVPFDPIVHQRALGSRRRLGIDRIDLYQAHWPNPGLPARARCSQALARLQRRGARHPRRREQLLAGGMAVRPSGCSAARCCPTRCSTAWWIAAPSGTCSGWAQEHDRLVIAYSPLAQGLLVRPVLRRRTARAGMRAMRPLFLPAEPATWPGELLDVAARRRRHATTPSRRRWPWLG